MNSIRPKLYRRLALNAALISATALVVYVLYRLTDVTLLLVLSIIVAAALRAPIQRLEQTRLGRAGAILLLYLLAIGVLGALTVMIGARLLEEFITADKFLPGTYDRFVASMAASDQIWMQTIAARLPGYYEMVRNIGQNGSEVAYQALDATYAIGNILISLVAILTLTFYWLIDEERFVRLWSLLLPAQQRLVARQTWYDIEERVGAYARSEALQFVLTLMMLWLGLAVLRVPYAASWALFGAVVQLIPWIGIPLTLLPAIPMLLTSPLGQTIAAITLVLITGVLMDRVLEPRLGVDGIVHPILQVLALMMLGEYAGVLGMVVALPLAATIQSVLSFLVAANSTQRVTTQSFFVSQIDNLRARVDRLYTSVPADPDQRRSAESLFGRVRGLLDKTEQATSQRVS